MYRLFENLVDPFQDHETTTPPKTLWAYVMTQMHPFRRLIPWMALTGLLVALFEAWMIWYAGRLIDIMTQAGPAHILGQPRGRADPCRGAGDVPAPRADLRQPPASGTDAGGKHAGTGPLAGASAFVGSVDELFPERLCRTAVEPGHADGSGDRGCVLHDVRRHLVFADLRRRGAYHPDRDRPPHLGPAADLAGGLYRLYPLDGGSRGQRIREMVGCAVDGDGSRRGRLCQYRDC